MNPVNRITSICYPIFNAFLVVLVSGLLLIPTDARSAQAPIDPFVGIYRGVSVKDPAGILKPTDIEVEIRRDNGGFVVDWHSVIVENGAIERRNHEVRFEPNPRHHGEPGYHVYREALRPGVSGNLRPADLMHGESLVWARIVGRRLTVYRMAIVKTGSQDLQIYRRTLENDGMRLEFNHMRDDSLLHTVTGLVERRANAAP